MQGSSSEFTRRLLACAIALVAVVGVLFARRFLDPVLGDDVPMTSFLVAVFLAAWFGGLWPGLFAMALALALGGYLFTLRATWQISDAGIQARIAVFVFGAVTISVLSELWQRARRRVENQSEELRREVAERRASETEALKQMERSRAAEERLHLSEQLHRLAVEAANDTIYDWSPANDHRVWSDTVRSMFHFSPDEVGSTSEWWAQQIHPEDRATVRASLDRAMNDGSQRWSAEYRFCCADGAYIRIYDRARILRDADGKAIRVVGSMQDVTERKRAADAIAHFKALFEASPACHLVMDPQFTVVAVSDAYLRATMRTRAELIDRPVFESFPNDPNDAQADATRHLRASLERVRSDKVTDVMGLQRYPIQRAAAAGSAVPTGFEERWWTISNSPVIGPGGELAFIIGSVEDVTDFVRANGEAAAATRMASRERLLEADIFLRAQELAQANRIIKTQNDRLRFLNDFDQCARDLDDPDLIVAYAAERLCRQLGANRCAWAEVEADEDHFLIVGDFNDGVPSIKGRWQMAAFGAEALRCMRAGESFVVENADPALLPDADPTAYRATNIGAVICVPMLEAGRFAAAMAVHQTVPRPWSAGEIELVETVTRRAFESLTRARIARELRISHARLSLLIEVSDATVGLDDPEAIKSMATRLLGIHLDVNRCLYAERGEDDEQMVVSGEYCAGVESVRGRMQFSAFGTLATQILCGDVERGVADVEGSDLSDADRASYRAAGIGSFILAPIRRQGRLVGAMAVHHKLPRTWSQADIELVSAVGNRCWESLQRVSGAQSLVVSAENLRDANERLGFLMELGDVAQALADPQLIMVTVAQRLCQRLRAQRCAWFEVESDGDHYVVRGDFADGLASRRGRHRFSLFGPRAREALLSNQTWVADDVESGATQGLNAEAFRAAGIGALIIVPLSRGGRFIAGLAVHSSTPRRWTRSEIELVELVAHRNYDALERTRIARDLEEANEHLQCLFDLGLALEPLSEPGEMMSVATRHLCRRLGADRCTWGEFEDDEDHYTVVGDHAVGLPSRVGRHRMGDFGPETLRRLRAGDVLRSDDIESEAGREFILAAFRESDIRAFLVVPVRKHGRLVAGMGVHQRRSREWRAAEIELLELFVQRCWEMMERARGVLELRLSQERLREADRAKDEFLATLAHELRNPLAPLSNAVQLLRPGIDETLRERARQTMKRQLRHMVRLVDDLLDVSRIRSGKLNLRREWVDLHEVVRNALEIADPQIRAARHRLAVRLPPQVVSVEADPARLAQVIANLLNNSARYTPPGGHIGLRVDCGDGDLAITVEDDGVGISAEALSGVFEMFAQGPEPAVLSGGGLGVGLSLVRKLVSMHGGTVEADSAGIGRGSRFTVRLPAAVVAIADDASRAAAQDRSAAARSTVVPIAATRRRILVADDNPDSVESMAGLLGLLGHEVKTANDGHEAIEIADRFRPDTIVLDLGMPRMDGLDAARHIRGQPWGGRITLIALTGWGQDEDRRRTREAGFDFHLVKPVDLEAFEKLLKGVAA